MTDSKPVEILTRLDEQAVRDLRAIGQVTGTDPNVHLERALTQYTQRQLSDPTFLGRQAAAEAKRRQTVDTLLNRANPE